MTPDPEGGGRVERMAARLEHEVRDYWEWFNEAARQHGPLVSRSGHAEAERKTKDAAALRSLLAAHPEPTKEVGEGQVVLILDRVEVAMLAEETVTSPMIAAARAALDSTRGLSEGPRTASSSEPAGDGPLAESDSTSPERCPTCTSPDRDEHGARRADQEPKWPHTEPAHHAGPSYVRCTDPWHTDPPQGEER